VYLGLGVSGVIENSKIFIGTAKFMANYTNVDISAFEQQINQFEKMMKSVVITVINDKVVGIMTITDTIKKSSFNVIAELQQLNIMTYMITGDNKMTAQAIADSININHVFAEIMPTEKSDIIKKLQADNKLVAMVGDGINDAPALSVADIGIAIGTGSDIALETANLVLVNQDLNSITTAIRLSKKTIRIIKQNLF